MVNRRQQVIKSIPVYWWYRNTSGLLEVVCVTKKENGKLYVQRFRDWMQYGLNEIDGQLVIPCGLDKDGLPVPTVEYKETVEIPTAAEAPKSATALITEALKHCPMTIKDLSIACKLPEDTVRVFLYRDRDKFQVTKTNDPVEGEVNLWSLV